MSLVIFKIVCTEACGSEASYGLDETTLVKGQDIWSEKTKGIVAAMETLFRAYHDCPAWVKVYKRADRKSKLRLIIY